MKLHQAVIHEMTGPVPYELTLQNIIDRGDTNDGYEIFVLSALSEHFSGLQATKPFEGSIPSSSGATSVVAIESIKSLSPSEKVNLAQYLLGAINYGYSATHSSQLSSSDWIRYVLQRQD
jgi:hypothetical protein